MVFHIILRGVFKTPNAAYYASIHPFICIMFACQQLDKTASEYIHVEGTLHVGYLIVALDRDTS